MDLGKRWMATVAACVVALLVMAQEHLVLRYDFSSVSGSSVSDASASGVTATLKGSAKVEEMGKYKVLNLGTASGYLDMTEKAGEVVKRLGDFSVSVYYRVNKSASLSGNGYFLWAFSDNAACGANSGIYSAYRLNAQRIATSTGGYGNEKGYSIGSASVQDEWVHVAYTQSGTTGKLYLNGVMVQSVSGMPVLSSTFTAVPTCCWMGRAPFTGDNYLANTLVYDFRVYDEALSDADVEMLSAEKEELDHEYRYGVKGDFTGLQTAVKNAESYIAGLDLTLYPASSLAEYMDAIQIAKDIIAEGKVNQDYIDEYTQALGTAKTKFANTKGFAFDVSDVADAYSIDRGFRHPGGLHTDEDFERIRQQLADGNERVTAAYQVLKTAEYAQSGIATWPVETIVRGGGVGENYINAARGATMAYQNALRWKIDGTEANAKAAVRILMAWANVTKGIGGDSNYALAAGLYGYEFAQAAELMRDYEGWSRDDFETFRRWMLDVWYPYCIGFLRGRNGTWENAGKWWQAPGHYWSNWGLCNALAVITIGVLCDDVFIYNQGMSFIKYDQVGTFRDPRTESPILNDGLTEFWGNLVVTTAESELETGAYGKLGQMNESGRDTGHAAMALGLAIDIAHQGWNQGDDLFSYMDHRIAAGIEYVAAQTQSVAGLPWTNYKYGTNGYYYTDSRCWEMTGPALGAQMRPYWGTVIGHYEGVKGVKMPFSEKAYEAMGIDAGGMGGTSGGYDHLGYSVLMNTRDVQLAPADKVPTELSPWMTYGGKTVAHNELGGLTNTWQTTSAASRGLAPGTVVTLSPQLPEGATDTGLWLWNTGETTREITVTASQSYNYRVEYTNENGVKSYQNFALAVDGDCESTAVTPTILYKGTTLSGATSVDVMYGSSLTLTVGGRDGWGRVAWDNGQTTESITLPQVTTSRDIQAYYQNQGGRKQLVTFHIRVTDLRPDIILNGKTLEDTLSVVVKEGDRVTLAPNVSSTRSYGTWQWNSGETTPSLTIADVQTSDTRSVTYTIDGHSSTITYHIYVKEDSDRLLDVGNYLIRHHQSGCYLTNVGEEALLCEERLTDGLPDASQVWYIQRPSSARYDLVSLSDSTSMSNTGEMKAKTYRPHRISFAKGTNYCAFRNSSDQYWVVTPDQTILYGTTMALTDYPFELIPVEKYATGITPVAMEDDRKDGQIYDLTGRRLSTFPAQGFYIQNGKKYLVR